MRREDRDGLERLFEACSSSCYCRYWHFEGDKNAWLDRLANHADENRRELELALEHATSEVLGAIALDDERIIGWAKVSPVDQVKKIYEQRFYRRLSLHLAPRPGVFVVGCFLVHPSHRRGGVGRALARQAVEIAVEHGATSIEAVPRRTSDPVFDEELWTGPASIFEGLGFTAIDDGTEANGPYPLMRRILA